MDPVAILEAHLGYHEAAGNCNIFSHYLGHPCEAWCADTCTACYQMSGHPLPAMQPGLTTGFASVWYGATWALKNHLLVPSWEGVRDDLICFGWEGKGLAGHPDEMHVAMLRNPSPVPKGGQLPYIGGNQSDQVSEETIESGSPLIIGVIQASKFLGTAVPTHVPSPAPTSSSKPKPVVITTRIPLAIGLWGASWPVAFIVKTPFMSNHAVGVYQSRMIARGWKTVPAGTPFSKHYGHPFVADSVYGDDTAAVTWAFQAEKGLTKDGRLSAATWLQASRTDNVTH